MQKTRDIIKSLLTEQKKSNKNFYLFYKLIGKDIKKGKILLQRESRNENDLSVENIDIVKALNSLSKKLVPEKPVQQTMDLPQKQPQQAPQEQPQQAQESFLDKFYPEIEKEIHNKGVPIKEAFGPGESAAPGGQPQTAASPQPMQSNDPAAGDPQMQSPTPQPQLGQETPDQKEAEIVGEDLQRIDNLMKSYNQIILTVASENDFQDAEEIKGQVGLWLKQSDGKLYSADIINGQKGIDNPTPIELGSIGEILKNAQNKMEDYIRSSK